jgi:hypothetical protein
MGHSLRYQNDWAIFRPSPVPNSEGPGGTLGLCDFASQKHRMGKDAALVAEEFLQD